MTPAGPRMSSEERRESVLRAALPVFARGGYEGTSTEDVARAAGISQPYLFRLFSTKKALFLALVERTFSRIADTFRDAAGGMSGEEALAAMGDSYAALLSDRDLLLLQLHAYAACDDDEVRAATREGFRELWQLVERLSGKGPDEVRSFFAMGMLMNVMAALDAVGLQEGWARACAPEVVLHAGAPART